MSIFGRLLRKRKSADTHIDEVEVYNPEEENLSTVHWGRIFPTKPVTGGKNRLSQMDPAWTHRDSEDD